MQYLADTVAIVRHFAKIGRIGKTAKHILKEADKGHNAIFISIVSMFEILYLSERNRIPIDLSKVKHKLQELDNYKIADLDMDVVEKAQAVKGLELHDRLITASALVLDVPILTSDDCITDSGLVEVIWR